MILSLSFLCLSFYGLLTNYFEPPTWFKVTVTSTVGFVTLISSISRILFELQSLKRDNCGVLRYLFHGVLKSLCGESYSTVILKLENCGIISNMAYCDPFSRELKLVDMARVIKFKEENAYKKCKFVTSLIRSILQRRIINIHRVACIKFPSNLNVTSRTFIEDFCLTVDKIEGISQLDYAVIKDEIKCIKRWQNIYLNVNNGFQGTELGSNDSLSSIENIKSFKFSIRRSRVEFYYFKNIKLIICRNTINGFIMDQIIRWCEPELFQNLIHLFSSFDDLSNVFFTKMEGVLNKHHCCTFTEIISAVLGCNEFEQLRVYEAKLGGEVRVKAGETGVVLRAVDRDWEELQRLYILTELYWGVKLDYLSYILNKAYRFKKKPLGVCNKEWKRYVSDCARIMNSVRKHRVLSQFTILPESNKCREALNSKLDKSKGLLKNPFKLGTGFNSFEVNLVKDCYSSELNVGFKIEDDFELVKTQTSDLRLEEIKECNDIICDGNFGFTKAGPADNLPPGREMQIDIDGNYRTNCVNNDERFVLRSLVYKEGKETNDVSERIISKFKTLEDLEPDSPHAFKEIVRYTSAAVKNRVSDTKFLNSFKDILNKCPRVRIQLNLKAIKVTNHLSKAVKIYKDELALAGTGRLAEKLVKRGEKVKVCIGVKKDKKGRVINKTSCNRDVSKSCKTNLPLKLNNYFECLSGMTADEDYKELRINCKTTEGEELWNKAINKIDGILGSKVSKSNNPLSFSSKKGNKGKAGKSLVKKKAGKNSMVMPIELQPKEGQTEMVLYNKTKEIFYVGAAAAIKQSLNSLIYKYFNIYKLENRGGSTINADEFCKEAMFLKYPGKELKMFLRSKNEYRRVMDLCLRAVDIHFSNLDRPETNKHKQIIGMRNSSREQFRAIIKGQYSGDRDYEDYF